MTSKPEQTTISQSAFYQKYRGAFSGILKWPQLDDVWSVLRKHADKGWYVYAIGEPVPQSPVTAVQLHTFIDELDSLLRKEHDEDYCGIVYVDDRQAPTFVKVYDPNNLGVVCGFSDNPPLPGWVISLLPPEPLSEQTFVSQSRRRWWQRLF
jgi:hypothetical protein